MHMGPWNLQDQQQLFADEITKSIAALTEAYLEVEVLLNRSDLPLDVTYRGELRLAKIELTMMREKLFTMRQKTAVHIETKNDLSNVSNKLEDARDSKKL